MNNFKFGYFSFENTKNFLEDKMESFYETKRTQPNYE